MGTYDVNARSSQICRKSFPCIGKMLFSVWPCVTEHPFCGPQSKILGGALRIVILMIKISEDLFYFVQLAWRPECPAKSVWPCGPDRVPICTSVGRLVASFVEIGGD